MVEWVKLLLVILPTHTGVPDRADRIQAALIPIQLPANASEKVAEDGPRAWSPTVHMGDQDSVSGSCLQPGSNFGCYGHLDRESATEGFFSLSSPL